MAKNVDLIIFDLDGTLVDSQEGIAKGINFALNKLGAAQRSLSEISSFIGTGVEDLVSKSLGPGNQDKFEQAKTIFENYRINYPDGAYLYPGAKEILEYFKDKKLVIVTNRKRDFALPTMRSLGINDYFADIFGADDVACKKPSSCPLDAAVAKFNSDKAKAIMVGDMDVDILAGKKASILTCAVTYGIGKKEDILKAGPDYIIDHILKLKEIIK